ncbi:MAG: hypothetical protein ACR2GA_00375 [Chloroflexota bacterium]
MVWATSSPSLVTRRPTVPSASVFTWSPLSLEERHHGAIGRELLDRRSFW